MGSENVGLWRLQDIGVPIKRMEGYPKISVSDDDCTVEEQFLMPADQFSYYANAMFPLIRWETSKIEGIKTRLARFPGLGILYAKSLKAEPWPSDKPGDPFGQDTGAPKGTYSDLMLVTITWAPPPIPIKKRDPDESDPFTFLEVSADSTAETLAVPSGGMMVWDDGKPVKEPNVAAIVDVPVTRWNVRWPVVPSNVVSTLLAKARWALGTVNDKAVPILYGALPETVLFTGFRLNQVYDWREDDSGGEILAPPVQLEYTFLEKVVTDEKGKSVGHNHVFRPGKGWQRVWLDKDKSVPLYYTTDFNSLFVL